MGVAVTVGMGVSVAEGASVGGMAVQVGAGATVAAVLQADRMKAAASAIPANLSNFFLVCMIHTLSLGGVENSFLYYHSANTRSTDLPCVQRLF